MAELVVIDQELCLNFNYKKMQCRKCQESCHAGCIDENLQIKGTSCNQCGLCLAACPTEAVAVAGYTRKALTELSGQVPQIGIVCRKNNSDSSWPCLGFVDGQLLLGLIADGKEVVIDTTSCEGCKPDVAIYLKMVVDQTNEILRAAQKNSVRQEKVPVKIQEKGISRRAFFGQLLGAAVETVREVARPSDSSPERLERSALRDKVKNVFAETNLHQPSAVFTGLRINSQCQGCGICTKFCAPKAITNVDRLTEIDLVHEPLRCTGCGVCAVHCPVQAISLGSADVLVRHKVVTAQLPRCASCGELYQPVNNAVVCLECMLKNHHAILR